VADPTAPHVAKTTKRKPDTCSVCGQPAVVSEVHHPRAATLHLGGAAWAHPDLAPLVRDLWAMPADVGDGALLISRHPENPRRGDHAAIVKSVLANGVYTPPKVQRSTTYVLAGNHSFDAMLDAGATRMPWVWLDVDDREARRIMADDNRTAELGGYDQVMLLENLRALDAAGDLALTAWRPQDLDFYIALSEVPFDPSAPPTDPAQALRDAGVGDFANEDGTPAFSAFVSFRTMAAYEEFRKRLDLTGPRRSRGIWYPEEQDLLESPNEQVVADA
jgi:hypothetical protein